MSVTSQQEPLAKIRSKQLTELLANGKRVDGRDPLTYRQLSIEPGMIERAEGSSMITLGNTKVLVGVKTGLGEPYSDTPNSAVLTVNGELVPLAHKNFEAGPPSEYAIELARVVDRGIRESKAIDLEKLAVVPRKKVYVIFIDIYVLNHDGNLIDASGFAALSALLNTKIPEAEIGDMGDIKYTGKKVQLPMRNYPIPVTFAKIDNKLIADPILEEETIAAAKLTITHTAQDAVCALQKSGIGTFDPAEILEARRIAIERAREIRSKLMQGATSA